MSPLAGWQGHPPWWHFLRQLGEQEWGWATSGLQVLGTNPFQVTIALKAKLKQIFFVKKKIERIKAHIPWDERIVAFLIISPPARSPCRHNSSLAAPPVTKIMKPTKRERKKQAEHQAGTIVCSERQPRLWVALEVSSSWRERGGDVEGRAPSLDWGSGKGLALRFSGPLFPETQDQGSDGKWAGALTPKRGQDF